MHGVAIPDALRRFLLGGAITVPHVEAILLIRGDRTQSWDARRIGARLYVSRRRAAELLAGLARLGILSRLSDSTSRYRYAPANAEMASLMDTLHDVYTRNLVEVTTLIHAAAGQSALQFAAAFRFRKGN